MLEELKIKVCEANRLLPEYGLVTLTWGNVSGIDRKSGLFVIKPSGVEYSALTPEDMVVVDLDCNVIEGKLKPSSDTPTHAELYRAFGDIGGITHTHSSYAAAWAQAGRDIPCYGTTHADCFHGPVPCLRSLTKEEIEGEYEKNTGLVIVSEFIRRGTDPLSVPGCLCKNHGPFTWGKDPLGSVENAAVLEETAKTALLGERINPGIKEIPQELLDKHFLRKHGKNSYYGQDN